YDLGQEWTDWTDLPFVYAVWAVRDGVDLGDAERAFVRAKEYGLAHAGRIAQREAAALGLDAGYCRRYLANIIRYDLGAAELAGLRKYHELAAELGLAPASRERGRPEPPVAHAPSPPEIWHFHKLNKLPLETVLRRLKDAGLGSLPGGGGEILVDRVRKQLTKGKALTDEWLEVNRVWHRLGGKSSCTMMFGHVETD